MKGRCKCTLRTENAWNEIVDALEGVIGFNKSHASRYADLSYQTAWLKYYYPMEFMAANDVKT